MCRQAQIKGNDLRELIFATFTKVVKNLVGKPPNSIAYLTGISTYDSKYGYD